MEKTLSKSFSRIVLHLFKSQQKAQEKYYLIGYQWVLNSKFSVFEHLPGERHCKHIRKKKKHTNLCA